MTYSLMINPGYAYFGGTQQWHITPEVSPEVAHEGIHLTVAIGTPVTFFAWCLFTCSPLVINRESRWAAPKLCKHPVSWETFTSGFGMLTFTAMDLNAFKMGLSSSVAPPRTLADTVRSSDPILNHTVLWITEFCLRVLRFECETSPTGSCAWTPGALDGVIWDHGLPSRSKLFGEGLEGGSALVPAETSGFYPPGCEGPHHTPLAWTEPLQETFPSTRDCFPETMS